MTKKLLILFLLSFTIATPIAFAQDAQHADVVEQEDTYEAHVYFFHSLTCPHCKDELEFLIKLAKEEPYQNVQFLEFEISQNSENIALFRQVGKVLDKDTSGVPFTVIGSEAIIGYRSEQTTGEQIRNAIDRVLKEGDPNLVGDLIAGMDPADIDATQGREQISSLPQTLDLGIFGEIQTANLSLPVLSIVLGGIDGFNPCAMWVLVFLISLLIPMEDKRRRWILGLTFIAASAAVYYVFMVAWLNLLMFLGMLFAVRMIIGFAALGGGAYSIHDYYTNKNAECKVGDMKKRMRVIDKLKDITKKQSLWLALAGIIALAFAVNLVELLCSAGIPAVFTQILTMSDISVLSYYLYILLYIVVFMLDDMIVFVIAMKTLEVTGMTTKYTRATRLIGGIIMLIIGTLMILKPEWLSF